PVLLNTHSPYPGHFHSDIVMAMVAHGDPAEKPRPGESQELQWVSPDEFAALPGAEPDAVMIMTMIVERVADSWLAIPATRWSLADAPAEAMTDRSVAEATAPDPLDDRETLGWGTAQ
ncbi:MAG: DNA mismatch repair protein MutT, partial [Cutibacterium acnes]|nr:DNA mismatch repair protein MutT [Cutibacterium acnes]